MQSLHIRHRPVGMINRRPAAQGGKAAKNKDYEYFHFLR
jgi:hypothetical protein